MNSEYCSVWWRLQHFWFKIVTCRACKGFKKLLLLFGQAKMVLVIAWFLYHFTFEPVPSMNSIWFIAFVSHLHVWVTKFKQSFMFFQLPVLKLNNVVWVCVHVRPSISSLSLKICCWCSSFVCWRACTWLSQYRQVLHLFLWWLVDVLPSFCL